MPITNKSIDYRLGKGESIPEYNARIALARAAGEEKPTGDISGKLEPESVTGGLGNFRLALKAALTEAAQEQRGDLFKQVYPVLGGAPGSVGDVLKMIRSQVVPPVEEVFTTILETRTKQQEQSMDLLETFAKDGTLGTMPDSALITIGRNAGLDEGVVTAWKSRIATAVVQDERMGQFEELKIQAEIENIKARTAEIGIGGAESYAPTPVTLAYVDQVTNDPDFVLINVPAEERDRVANFIYNRDVKLEATDTEGVADKINSLNATQQTAPFTEMEFRIWFMNMKENKQQSYEDAVKAVSDFPVTNKKLARFIAGEVHGKLAYTPYVPGEEVGAIIPEGEEEVGVIIPKKGIAHPPFYSGIHADFSAFPSIFNF
ncbi:MAG: hypothetical protein P9M03_10730 [Candidatus Theseobacter exili]|nr:hypothetical protein [Candidatus Theseobacter exili]